MVNKDLTTLSRLESQTHYAFDEAATVRDRNSVRLNWQLRAPSSSETTL